MLTGGKSWADIGIKSGFAWNLGGYSIKFMEEKCAAGCDRVKSYDCAYNTTNPHNCVIMANKANAAIKRFNSKATYDAWMEKWDVGCKQLPAIFKTFKDDCAIATGNVSKGCDDAATNKAICDNMLTGGKSWADIGIKSGFAWNLGGYSIKFMEEKCAAGCDTVKSYDCAYNTTNPKKPPPVAVADMSIVLGGYTKASFGAAAQANFKKGVATAVKISADKVTIYAVNEVPLPTRHLLAKEMGINVDFQVEAATTDAANKVGADLKKVAESGALVTTLKAAGLDKTTSTKVTALNVMTKDKAKEKVKKAAAASSAILVDKQDSPAAAASPTVAVLLAAIVAFCGMMFA